MSIDDTILLDVQDLVVRFRTKKKGFFGEKEYLRAVDTISFQIPRGATMGLVGESGSGKTTAALAVAQLVKIHQGKIILGDVDLSTLSVPQLRKMRARMQIIFQDPYSSLNPRLRAEEILYEPLESLGIGDDASRKAIIDEAFQAVGLRKEQYRLFPHQFSGGQRQRIGIARALVSKPELIICDEPVSALDVAVQAQILNLLRRLQDQYNLTYLFISHDLGVVQHMCDWVCVMYMGKIVEYADRMTLFNAPKHPYTQALLAAVPSVERAIRGLGQKALVPGDPPNLEDLPKGCRFASRCVHVHEKCHTDDPAMQTLSSNHRVACHLTGS